MMWLSLQNILSTVLARDMDWFSWLLFSVVVSWHVTNENESLGLISLLKQFQVKDYRKLPLDGVNDFLNVSS